MSRAGWTTKIHMVAADARMAVSFSLSPRNAGDAPEGRELLKKTTLSANYVVMDRAYEGDETRQLVFDLGLTPVVPPKSNRIDPWEYDRQMYKRAAKLNDCFVDSRDSGGYSRVSTSLMWRLRFSFTSHSSMR